MSVAAGALMRSDRTAGLRQRLIAFESRVPKHCISAALIVTSLNLLPGRKNHPPTISTSVMRPNAPNGGYFISIVYPSRSGEVVNLHAKFRLEISQKRPCVKYSGNDWA